MPANILCDFSNLMCSEDAGDNDTNTDQKGEQKGEQKSEQQNENELLEELDKEIARLKEHAALIQEDKKILNEAKILHNRLPRTEEKNNAHLAELEKKGYCGESNDNTESLKNIMNHIKNLGLETEKNLKKNEEIKAEIINKRGGRGGGQSPTEYVQELADSTPMGFDDTLD